MAARKPVEEADPLPTREQWIAYCATFVAADSNFIPPEQLCVEDIEDWQAASKRMKEAQDIERKYRDKIYRHLFKNPEEGANNVKLTDGRKITATRNITRKPDAGLIDAMGRRTVGDMRSYLTQLGVDLSAFDDSELVVNAVQLRLDEVFKWTPELVTADYRKLTPEQLILVDSLLEIKDGSPQVKIA